MTMLARLREVAKQEEPKEPNILVCPLVAIERAELRALIEVVDATKLYLMARDNLYDADSGSKAEWIAGEWADEKERELRNALNRLGAEV